MAKLKVAALALAVGLAGTAGGVAAWQARAAGPAAAQKEGATKPELEADGDRLLFLAGGLHFLVEEDYRAAERAFSLLLKKYPDSRLAPKAAELAVLAKQLTTRGADARKVNQGRHSIEAVLGAEKDIQMQQAEKDFAMAEFYRRTGHAGAAHFYYELVGRRYPGTPFAERAEARLRELRAQAEAPKPSEKKPPARVGQVFIKGNTKTPTEAILKHVPIYPGQVLSYPDLKAAEKNLERTGRFVVDPGKGIRPTVTVKDDPLNPESEFKDIIITVQENKTGSLMFGQGVNSNGGLTGSIQLNERNFDVTGVPASSDGSRYGSTFRGAGQELRVPAGAAPKK